jgi:hypothetical protein
VFKKKLFLAPKQDYGGKCKDSVKCKDHLLCSGMGICECKTGYFWHDDYCHLQKGYYKNCLGNEWCRKATQNTECDMNTNLCSCSTDTFWNGQRCGKLNEFKN